MTKGEDTRTAILSRATDLASELGLGGLSLGHLSKEVGMSKSGLYAHFGSKEDLQISVLDHAAQQVEHLVMRKAFKEPRGLPRIRAYFKLWLEWASKETKGGCPFVSAATELDDQEGPVRACLVKHMKAQTQTMERSAQICKDEGHFRQDTDVAQFAFHLWGIMLSFHHYHRLMRTPNAQGQAYIAFESLLKQFSVE